MASRACLHWLARWQLMRQASSNGKYDGADNQLGAGKEAWTKLYVFRGGCPSPGNSEHGRLLWNVYELL
jgi:hypothetical protein